MPRNTDAPSIPESPPERRDKPPKRARDAKVGPEKQPEPAPSIPDLWAAFDAVWGFGESVEAEPASPAKPREQKGSRKR